MPHLRRGNAAHEHLSYGFLPPSARPIAARQIGYRGGTHFRTRQARCSRYAAAAAAAATYPIDVMETWLVVATTGADGN